MLIDALGEYERRRSGNQIAASPRQYAKGKTRLHQYECVIWKVQNLSQVTSTLHSLDQ